jgi:hypothetical protein
MESASVAALLQDIFTAEDEPATTKPMSAAVPAESCGGLDARHSGLLRELATGTTWPRAHVESCAARFGLLPDGAIEVLNELALELSGDLLVEGEDPLSLNPSVLKELMA